MRRNLPVLLSRAREAIMTGFRRELREYGLTEQQWRVIRALDEHGELETGQIAEHAFIVAPSLSGVLNRMEQAGLVIRHRLSNDQRKIYVTLTKKSRAMAKALRVRLEQHYLYLESKLGMETLDALMDKLDQVIAIEGKVKPEPVVRERLTP